MVGVSDDVNEYAMALKDTEEKISRCPKRVRSSSRSDFAILFLGNDWWFCGNSMIKIAAMVTDLQEFQEKNLKLL